MNDRLQVYGSVRLLLPWELDVSNDNVICLFYQNELDFGEEGLVMLVRNEYPVTLPTNQWIKQMAA